MFEVMTLLTLIVAMFIGQAFPLTSITHGRSIMLYACAAHSSKPAISRLEFPTNSLERKHTRHQVLGSTIKKSIRLYASSKSDERMDKKPEGNEQSSTLNATNIEEEKERNIWKSYIVLAVLLVTFASNQWSRQAMYYLCDFSAGSVGESFKYMNRGLDFSKDMYAALASLGFTLVFATVSLFSGSVTDRFPRNSVATISCMTWSLATALQAFATQFSDLIPLRALIGASQAFFNPAAYTLLADIFPARLLGSINGIFSGGIYLGGALASLSIVLNTMIGWRNTLILIGVVGIVASILCFIALPEPRDNVEIISTKQELSVVEDKAFISQDSIVALFEVLSSNQARLLYLASILRFCAGFSIGIWKAPFIFEKFPGQEMAFSSGNALVMTVGGLSSTLLGGYLSDLLANPRSTSTRPRARAWIPAIGSIIAAPLFAGFVLADSPQSTALFLLGEYLFAECWFGPTLAVLFQCVPPNRRGVAQGLFSLTTALGNFGPVLVGRWVDSLDKVGESSGALGNALIYVVSGAYLISGLLFALVAVDEDAAIEKRFTKS